LNARAAETSHLRHTSGTTTRALLALLGFLNTFTCDWWVRRFVDRHVTAPVVNTATLLRESRQSTLAGSRRLPKAAAMAHIEARVKLEVLAAQGFDLGPGDMATMLSDFSDGAAACPASLRAAILDAVQ